MGEAPDHDPKEYILKNLKTYSVDRVPPEKGSIFRKMAYMVEICSLVSIKIDKRVREEIKRFVIKYSNEDAGFGYENSTLTETMHALSILEELKVEYPRRNVRRFVETCRDPIYGFVNVPNASISAIEYIYAGVQLSERLRCRYDTRRCIEFIDGCQRENGGFSRVPTGGIATIENTYYAIASLSQILHEKFNLI